MLKPADLPDFFVLVSDKPVSVFPIVFYLDGLGAGLKKWVGDNLKHLLIDFKNGEMRFCVNEGEWAKLGKTTFKKIKEDPAFFNGVYQDVLQACGELVDAATRARDADYSKIANAESLGIYGNFARGMARLTASGIVFSLVEARNEFLTKELRALLGRKRPQERISEAFTLLTTPAEASFVKKEKTSLLKFSIKAKRELPNFESLTPRALLENIEASEGLKREFDEHYENFHWLSYNYEGPSFSKLDIVRMLLEHSKAGNMEEQLSQLDSNETELMRKQAALEREIGLGDSERYLFECARKMVFLKGYRKDMAFKAYCFMEKWLADNGRKFRLGARQMRQLMPEEVGRMLTAGMVPENLRDRQERSILVYKNGVRELQYGGAAEGFAAKIIEEDVPINEKTIRGSCACSGVARGTVRIINIVDDLGKMRPGDVLVSMQTNPNLMPAIGKAGAIVTDTGGITCHAAIVSRELQIPCVIGTKVATKWLKDGDLVEVDATHGTVRKI